MTAQSPLVLDIALEINHALVGIFKIINQRAEISTFTAHKDMVTRPAFFSLRLWLEATALVDEQNVTRQRQAMLLNQVFVPTPTLTEAYIAAIYTFLSWPVGQPLVWDGTKALIITPAVREADTQPAKHQEPGHEQSDKNG